jgi:hypothetical protein
MASKRFSYLHYRCCREWSSSWVHIEVELVSVVFLLNCVVCAGCIQRSPLVAAGSIYWRAFRANTHSHKLLCGEWNSFMLINIYEHSQCRHVYINWYHMHVYVSPKFVFTWMDRFFFASLLVRRGWCVTPRLPTFGFSYYHQWQLRQ